MPSLSTIGLTRRGRPGFISIERGCSNLPYSCFPSRRLLAAVLKDPRYVCSAWFRVSYVHRLHKDPGSTEGAKEDSTSMDPSAWPDRISLSVTFAGNSVWLFISYAEDLGEHYRGTVVLAEFRVTTIPLASWQGHAQQEGSRRSWDMHNLAHTQSSQEPDNSCPGGQLPWTTLRKDRFKEP